VFPAEGFLGPVLTLLLIRLVLEPYLAEVLSVLVFYDCLEAALGQALAHDVGGSRQL
jgi:hypothetical protein